MAWIIEARRAENDRIQTTKLFHTSCCRKKHYFAMYGGTVYMTECTKRNHFKKRKGCSAADKHSVILNMYLL